MVAVRASTACVGSSPVSHERPSWDRSNAAPPDVHDPGRARRSASPLKSSTTRALADCGEPREFAEALEVDPPVIPGDEAVAPADGPDGCGAGAVGAWPAVTPGAFVARLDMVLTCAVRGRSTSPTRARSIKRRARSAATGAPCGSRALVRATAPRDDRGDPDHPAVEHHQPADGAWLPRGLIRGSGRGSHGEAGRGGGRDGAVTGCVTEVTDSNCGPPLSTRLLAGAWDRPGRSQELFFFGAAPAGTPGRSGAVKS